MAKELRVAVVDTDGSITTEHVPFTLSWAQQTVGGLIQSVPTPNDDASLYINDEGALIGLDYNETATLFVAGVGLLPGDFLRGPAIVTGPIDASGNATSLPPSAEARLRTVQVLQQQLASDGGEVGAFHLPSVGAQYCHDTIRTAHSLRWCAVTDIDGYGDDPLALVLVTINIGHGDAPSHIGRGATVQGHPLYGLDYRSDDIRLRLYLVAVTPPGRATATFVPVAGVELPPRPSPSTPATWLEGSAGELRAAYHDADTRHTLPLTVEQSDQGGYRWCIGEGLSTGQAPTRLHAALGAEVAADRLSLHPGAPTGGPTSIGLEIT